jgi:hypothetical protein
MKWFFAHNGNHDDDVHIQAMIRSAVANTSLDGYFIYFDLDGKEERPILAFAEEHGITVLRREPSILADLQRMKAKYSDYPFEIATGVWLRIDVPQICQELGFEDEFVLYTDCDVLFLDDPSRESDQPFFKPEFLSNAPEVDKENWDRRNAGVMVMNVANLRGDFPAFRQFITSGDTLYEELWKRGLQDQAAYRIHYSDRWEKLPLEYNWKPYWGFNEDARIVHFHGPKVDYIRHMLSGRRDRVRPMRIRLFEQDPDAYRKYLALFEEYASD